MSVTNTSVTKAAKSIPLTLSIVIPVYNEEHHLKACLDAVAAQTVKPMEVIVVDNNCTDGSMAIARLYPFVRIIKEKKQGRGHARSAGFSAAKGDIIARTDCDSRPMPDWAAHILHDFKKDPDMGGLTGPAYTNTLPWRFLPNPRTRFWSVLYMWSTISDECVQTMWGANMALRRDVWHEVRGQVINDDKFLHEDIDLSLLLHIAGYRIGIDYNMLISMRGASYHYLPKMIKYYRMRFANRRVRHNAMYSPDSKVKKIGFWQQQLMRLVCFFPLLLFSLTALLWLPLDYYMFNVRHDGDWPR